MDTLPRELIEIIMSMVPTDDLVTKFRAVNKIYFALSQSLVSEIGPSFKRDQTSNDHQIMVLARDYPSITSLNVTRWNISVSALRVILTKFPRLKELKLPPLYLSLGNELLQHKVPSLTSLTMQVPSTYYSRFNIGSVDITSINNVFPNLEHLELTDNPSQKIVDNLLRGITSLKSLAVHGSSAVRFANVPLLKKLTILQNDKEEISINDCPMLETLNILFCDLTNFKFLQNIPTLQHLTLQRGFYNSGSWGRTEASYENSLGNNLLKCTSLKTLRIYRYDVTSEDLERVVYGLPNLKKFFIASSKHEVTLPETALLLQEKNKDIEIIVAKRKFTMDIDLNVINDLTKVETSGPFIECQYCHLQYQCATEVHEEVCLKWPAWSCLFQDSGCTKTGMTKEELRVHIGKCDYYFISCPMQSCGETIRRHERQAHDKKHEKTFEFRLKETRMICPNLQRGCMEMFATKGDMLNHMSKCQHSHCLCMSCKESFASIDQCTKHMSECHVVRKKRVISDEDVAKIVSKAAEFSESNSKYSTERHTSLFMRSSYGY